MLTNQSSSPAQAISWTWTLPVTWQERGRKQASCRPAGGSFAAAAGTLWNSQTCTGVPMASRSPASARPIGDWKAAEMRVEVIAVGADDHQLARLISGDQ